MRLPRFTIRTAAIFVAFVAAALWAISIPGHRAKELVRMIRDGDTDGALAMLEDLPAHAAGYRNVVEHVSSLANAKNGGFADDVRQIEVEPATFRQLLTFQRSVLVGKGWGGGNCQFIVTLTSVSAGQNWFHVW